jgi:hypothetical protein
MRLIWFIHARMFCVYNSLWDEYAGMARDMRHNSGDSKGIQSLWPPGGKSGTQHLKMKMLQCEQTLEHFTLEMLGKEVIQSLPPNGSRQALLAVSDHLKRYLL